MMFGGLRGSKSMGSLINLQKIGNVPINNIEIAKRLQTAVLGPKSDEPLKSDPSNFDDTNGGQINKSRVMSPKTQSRMQFGSYNSMSPDLVSLEKTPHFTTKGSPDKTLMSHKKMMENSKSPVSQFKYSTSQKQVSNLTSP